MGGNGPFGGSCQIHGTLPLAQSESEDLPNLTDEIDSTDIKSPVIKNPAYSHQYCPPEIHRSCFCVRFIAEHTKLQEDSTKVRFTFILFKLMTSYSYVVVGFLRLTKTYHHHR